MSKKSVQIPGTEVPIWITIAQIVSVTLLLIALLVAFMYLFKLVFVYIIIPVVIVLARALTQIFGVVKTAKGSEK